MSRADGLMVAAASEGEEKRQDEMASGHAVYLYCRIAGGMRLGGFCVGIEVGRELDREGMEEAKENGSLGRLP